MMGIDAQIWLKPNREISLEEGDKLNADIIARFGPGGACPSSLWIRDGKCFSVDGEYIKIACMARYWGECYERGPWMWIFALCEYLARVFPGDVFYFSDSTDDPGKPWPEMREKLWTHLIGDNWNRYYTCRD